VIVRVGADSSRFLVGATAGLSSSDALSQILDLIFEGPVNARL
jgi:hypothetical protein